MARHPKTTPRQMIAKCVRQLGASERGVRANAFTAIERAREGAGLSWTDIGDWIEGGDPDDSKYTEDEMQETYRVARAEGVAAGIKIGQARAGNGSGNGRITLPNPQEMAGYCHDRLPRLKDDKQREFITDMFLITRQGSRGLSLNRLGYLASIYIQIGGRV
jgi:hypothetical protein